MHFGTAAIVGRSNVGKSTLLNAALGQALAIVSPLPQTTRDTLLGIVDRDGAQIAFLDTPGIHRPVSELGRRMNAAALEAARSADVVVFMTDVWTLLPGKDRRAVPEDPVHPEDRRLLQGVPESVPCILVINKIDLLRDKSRLLPLMHAFSEIRELGALIPVSVRTAEGVDRVLDAIAAALPEGPAGYEEDMLTNRPVSFFVREYIREQVLLTSRREVPHAVAVSIDRFEETKRKVVIQATLHVEKPGQRAILVGRGGERIRDIGIGARRRIEELLGRSVHLELFVRVTPRWKDVPRQLAELGYEAPAPEGASHPSPLAGPEEKP